jgi:hypothetical protein
LYTESCLQKLETLISHTWANTRLGRSMRINLNWTQLLTGLQSPIFESVHKIKYIPNNWFLLHLRSFTIACNATIIFQNLWTPTLERKNDLILMECFMQLNLTPAELRMANTWRLFFKVNKLSDICNVAGTHISREYQCRPLQRKVTFPRVSKLQWPCQPEPTHDLGFRAWTKSLRLAFQIEEDGRLSRRFVMGKWTSSFTASQSRWNFCYDLCHNNFTIPVLIRNLLCTH